jgi:hypothetical protein
MCGGTIRVPIRRSRFAKFCDRERWSRTCKKIHESVNGLTLVNDEFGYPNNQETRIMEITMTSFYMSMFGIPFIFYMSMYLMLQ